MGEFYREYSEYLASRFEGKVQKLTVDAGFTCPNRDGSKSVGGCIYCNNRAFSPAVAPAPVDVRAQLEAGKVFFARKYPTMRYLAYFQAYTSTYGRTPEELLALYEEAASVSDIVGIVIGTRPDCVSPALVSLLADLNRRRIPVTVEFGVETSHDSTLSAINRCHSWADTVSAVNQVAEADIDIGVHLIMGLPGETTDDMLLTVRRVCNLPVSTIKFHQLQVVRGTLLARKLEESPDSVDITLFSLDDYIALCSRIIDIVPDHIAIERFTASAPADLLIAPRWGIKNFEFVEKLKKFKRNRTSVC
ncbi:MAG: TIGR01212 family radical SAM protein [Muribaculaceae bacterium]|nr:TIGR01212 family radical SAM protein [Muribaculaceae bacterium]